MCTGVFRTPQDIPAAALHFAGLRIIMEAIRRKYGKDDLVMKKVLLLGDSIRMGYDDYVKELLDGKCEVIYDPDDNGRFAAYTLWQANQMFKKYGKFDVVHWNNGYWDMNVEPPMAELGDCAAELLIRQIENPEFGFTQKKLASKLILIRPD